MHKNWGAIYGVPLEELSVDTPLFKLPALIESLKQFLDLIEFMNPYLLEEDRDEKRRALEFAIRWVLFSCDSTQSALPFRLGPSIW